MIKLLRIFHCILKKLDDKSAFLTREMITSYSSEHSLLYTHVFIFLLPHTLAARTY